MPSICFETLSQSYLVSIKWRPVFPNFSHKLSSFNKVFMQLDRSSSSNSHMRPTLSLTHVWMWLFFVKIRGFEHAIASRPLVVNDSYLDGMTNRSQSTKASCFSSPICWGKAYIKARKPDITSDFSRRLYR